MNFTEADFDSLTTKLDALDLTDGETAALHEILDRATRFGEDHDEVEGFSFQPVGDRVVSGPIPLPTSVKGALGMRGFILPGEAEN